MDAQYLKNQIENGIRKFIEPRYFTARIYCEDDIVRYFSYPTFSNKEYEKVRERFKGSIEFNRKRLKIIDYEID